MWYTITVFAAAGGGMYVVAMLAAAVPFAGDTWQIAPTATPVTVVESDVAAVVVSS